MQTSFRSSKEAQWLRNLEPFAFCTVKIQRNRLGGERRSGFYERLDKMEFTVVTGVNFSL